MKRGVVCLFKLFTNVEKVDFASGDHDADQRSVVRAKALRIESVFEEQWPTIKHTHVQIASNHV